MQKPAGWIWEPGAREESGSPALRSHKKAD
jgi:hypothetical protein